MVLDSLLVVGCQKNKHFLSRLQNFPFLTARLQNFPFLAARLQNFPFLAARLQNFPVTTAKLSIFKTIPPSAPKVVDRMVTVTMWTLTNIDPPDQIR